jgi:hypothetical protein
MKQQRSLAMDTKRRKRRILLGSLIPLGCLVIGATVVLPIILTQCYDKKIDLTSEYFISDKQQSIPSKNYIIDYIHDKNNKTTNLGIEDFV